MDKTFTVAGTSIKKGEMTLRFANGTAEARAKVLLKDNHTEIMLFNLPNPMTKADAIAWLEANSTATPVIARLLANSTATPVDPKAPKAQKEIRNPVVKTGKAVSTFRAVVGNDDDMKNPIFRAVYEAGKKEMQVTAEQEVEAMKLHKLSCIDFVPWPQISVEARNEFRAMTIHCPKAVA